MFAAGSRSRSTAHAAAAGLAIVGAMPPWGFWPLAFIGLALFDRLIAGRLWRSRLKRGALAAAFWLAPGMVWMIDLTAPGYVIAVAVFSVMFGGAAALAPGGAGRRVALPGAFVLAEFVRWYWPFGGVPLATLPMSQVASPLGPTVRVLGDLMLVAVTVAAGMALSAAAARQWRVALSFAFLIILSIGWAAVAPQGRVIREIDVAVVQGGGPQRTRAEITENPNVLQRHLDATALVQGPVDLVLWPENVVNPEPMRADGTRSELILYEDEARAAVTDTARRLNSIFLPGWFVHLSATANDNFTEAVDGNGDVLDSYHKVQLVPFGEYVPLRSFVDNFAGDALPARDTVPGDGPAVLRTPTMTMGIAISWEIFFDHRARDAIRNGGQILVNPTNGSSYRWTIVQSQQIASSRLRALETGRWVLQAAPTGFSAIIDDEGRVLQRTGVSEKRVLQGTAELREGRTLAVRVGVWPMLAIALALFAFGWMLNQRRGDDEDLPEGSRDLRTVD